MFQGSLAPWGPALLFPLCVHSPHVLKGSHRVLESVVLDWFILESLEPSTVPG